MRITAAETQNNVPNCDDGYIGGVMDLPDFLPLHLDLAGLIRVFGTGTETTYRFADVEDRLNIICTDLDQGDAGKYLTESCNAAGEDAGLPLLNATVRNIGGFQIPATVLQAMKNDPGKGVAVVEGYRDGTDPLVLEISSNGVVVCSVQIPLCVSEITAMYRTVDLRDGPAAFPAEPPNYPDAETDGKTVIFLHGFSVSSADATVWFNEMFKRLYRSGSRARFVGVKWKGDEGAIDGLNYHQNVVNAFNTASNLAVLVNSIPGEKIIMAHSLGNMVVASAIADHGMQVNKYFMLNAAIPSEAFDLSCINETPSGNMINGEWFDYTNRVWSANFFTLFDAGVDERGNLTWQSRFTNVLDRTKVYNYYSSGDEVFTLFNILSGTLWGDTGGLQGFAWQKQEHFKGRGFPHGTDWAGWGFELFRTDQGNWRSLDSSQANSIPPEVLSTNSIFIHQPIEMFTSNITDNAKNALLAKAIPALSAATGFSSILINSTENDERNHNLNTATTISRPNNWPRINEDWLHSDIKNVAYFYVFPAFNQLITQGELK